MSHRSGRYTAPQTLPGDLLGRVSVDVRAGGADVVVHYDRDVECSLVMVAALDALRRALEDDASA